jgi:hypothetical protein
VGLLNRSYLFGTALSFFNFEGGNGIGFFDPQGIMYTMDVTTFLEFVYPETKDLCKLFLTLVSGILVFSVTFSEKIVSFQTAGKWARSLLLTAWVMFVIAIISGGSSLTLLFLAAEEAKTSQAGWAELMVNGGYCLFGAGTTFCLGLLALALSGAITVLRRSDSGVIKTPITEVESSITTSDPDNSLSRTSRQTSRKTKAKKRSVT